MSTLTRRALRFAVVVAAASAPSSALASVDHLSQAQLAQLGSYEQAVMKQLGPTPGGLAGPVVPEQAASVRAVASTWAPARGGFHWDDAGIGAAGMLVLLGIGAGSAGVVTRRRAAERTM